jgi:hypothetical protein
VVRVKVVARAYGCRDTCMQGQRYARTASRDNETHRLTDPQSHAVARLQRHFIRPAISPSLGSTHKHSHKGRGRRRVQRLCDTHNHPLVRPPRADSIRTRASTRLSTTTTTTIQFSVRSRHTKPCPGSTLRHSTLSPPSYHPPPTSPPHRHPPPFQHLISRQTSNHKETMSAPTPPTPTAGGPTMSATAQQSANAATTNSPQNLNQIVSLPCDAWCFFFFLSFLCVCLCR